MQPKGKGTTTEELSNLKIKNYIKNLNKKNAQKIKMFNN